MPKEQEIKKNTPTRPTQNQRTMTGAVVAKVAALAAASSGAIQPRTHGAGANALSHNRAGCKQQSKNM